MSLDQLLMGKGWPEIWIVRTNQIEHMIAKILGMAAITRPVALSGRQTISAGAIIGLQEPVNLAAADVQRLGGLNDA